MPLIDLHARYIVNPQPHPNRIWGGLPATPVMGFAMTHLITCLKPSRFTSKPNSNASKLIFGFTTKT
jgi:hypothetical protein